IPGFEEHPPGHSGRQYQPTAGAVLVDGFSAAHQGDESLFWADPGVFLTGRRHDRAATVASAVSSIHDGRSLPGQRGPLEVQRGYGETGKAPFARLDLDCVVHIFEAP